MPSSMGSEGGAQSLPRWAHTRRPTAMTRFMFLGLGTMLAIPTGWNLQQFIAHGRLFIMRHGGESSWTYWNEDAADVGLNLLISSGFLALGLALLGLILLNLALRLCWGAPTIEPQD